MFHPTLDPRGLSDQELESKINDATLKINQARQMNNQVLYNQVLAIYNTYQLELEHRKIQKSKEEKPDDGLDLDSLINVK